MDHSLVIFIDYAPFGGGYLVFRIDITLNKPYLSRLRAAENYCFQR